MVSAAIVAMSCGQLQRHMYHANFTRQEHTLRLDTRDCPGYKSQAMEMESNQLTFTWRKTVLQDATLQRKNVLVLPSFRSSCVPACARRVRAATGSNMQDWQRWRATEERCVHAAPSSLQQKS